LFEHATPAAAAVDIMRFRKLLFLEYTYSGQLYRPSRNMQTVISSTVHIVYRPAAVIAYDAKRNNNREKKKKKDKLWK
jgi:hypothetical protein